MRVSGQQAPRYFDFLNGMLQTDHRPDRSKVIAVERGDDIAAVVLYSRISTRSCEMTIATDGGRDWATRSTLAEIFGYPFLQLRLHRVMVVVAASNAASLSLCKRLGYVVEGCVREAMPGDEDGILMGMLRRECRWIGGTR